MKYGVSCLHPKITGHTCFSIKMPQKCIWLMEPFRNEKQWWSKRNNGGVKEVRHWWEPPSEKLSPLPVQLPWSWKIWHIIYLTSSTHLAAWQPCSASAHLRPVALVALALRLAVPVKMSDHWRGPRWRTNFQPFAIYAGINCNLWRYSESCWTFRTCLWVWTALPKIIGWVKHIK